MKLHRVTLRNYRGVEERSVTFAPRGVTVVAGPNEIGKSSVAEALDLLLDQLDSSKRKDVRDVQPVHRDAGAEVEAEIEAGPYRFTYRKRWHRRPETELTVHAPRRENHTGREAHERVLALLGETVDLELWRALRIRQGAELALPQLAGRASLAQALDAAAGQSQADAHTLSIVDAARAEFERWHTPGGKPRKELTDLADAVTSLEQEHAQVAEALRRLDDAVARSRAAAARRAELRRRLADDEARATEAAARQREMERRARDVEVLAAQADAAESQRDAVRRERAQRGHLAEALEQRRRELDAARDAARAAPAAESAATALRAADEALAAARTRLEVADAVLAVREGDAEFRRDELDQQQLGERLARVRDADAAAADAAETLARVRVDEEALRALREAERHVTDARIRAESGSAEVHVAAARDVVVRTGDTEDALAGGSETTRHVLDELVVDAPGVVRVTVRPGGSAAGLRETLRDADAAFRALLARHGCADVRDAEVQIAQRQEAERALARRDDIVRNDLRDLTRETLAHKLERVAARVAAYGAERAKVAGADELPADFDAAQEAFATARRARDAAAVALEDARRAQQAARDDVERHGLAAAKARALVEAAERAATDAVRALEALRAAESDDALAARSERLEAAARDARAAADAAQAQLVSERPDDVARAAHGAAAAVAATRDELRGVEDEALRLATLLDELGQQGLAERLDTLAARLHRARHQRDAAQRAAQAAKLLHDTLVAHRDAARRAYVAPLRERVRRLGAVVFGADFDVELSDELAIASRSLGNVTVPFESLSGGAREQLGLVLRVAAAQLVSDDGGVPLLLDDALGYSDAARLEALGAVLALAGERCQVIVLTCMPERYRHVAGARHVRLDG